MNNNEYAAPDSESEWVITYSDLMSLLLCFFIMLYAVSTVQETKFQSATESLRGGFGLFGNAASDNVFPPKARSKKAAAGRKPGGTILFETGSEELSESARQELNAVYRQIADSPLTVRITAASMPGETAVYRRDLDLAHARSLAVWDYLVSLGMNRERCQLVLQSGKDAGAYAEIAVIP
ncbi:MAG: OmpA family protein [Planctomycetaceae bacterium]|nr:OmpA family protein [Planctomycetaceae bacterium]